MARFQFTSLPLTGMVVVAVVLLGLSGGLGLYGLNASGERLETLNRAGLEAVADPQLIERHIGLGVEQLEPAVRNPRRVDMDAVSPVSPAARRPLSSCGKSTAKPVVHPKRV